MVLLIFLTIPAYYGFAVLGHHLEDKKLAALNFRAVDVEISAQQLRIVEKNTFTNFEGKKIPYVQIRNQNPRIALTNAQFEFSSGLSKATGRFSLPAGESTYLIGRNMDVTSFNFQYTNPEWKRVSSSETISRTKSELYVDNQLDYLVLEVGLYNPEIEDVSSVRLLAILRDKDKRIVSMQEVLEDKIESKSTKNLRLLWPGLTDDSLEVELQYFANY